MAVPQQSTMRRLRPLSLVGCVLLAFLTLLSCSAPKPPRVRQVEPSRPFQPPPAVAPPDVGVDPPVVRLLAQNSPPRPLEARPQRQLTGWAVSLSDGLNIPRAALEAYGYAARSLQTSTPGCGMSWTVLAGIGEAESDHGRFGGARLDPNGNPTIPIRGVPLDGQNGLQRIPDTDHPTPAGADPTYVRAMGPFQFIPSDWKKWGQDADGSGVADPDNIYDAALAAGTYLCATAGDIRQPERFWAAVLTYNQSQSYGQEVLNWADYYGRTSRVLLRQPPPSGTASPLQSGR
jgi:membrane-bound lytic murein transglycosylase B